tara:strand:+ start:245 stop:775 length:531 start_codon:yes stop_codon:yes gene_type:complete
MNDKIFDYIYKGAMSFLSIALSIGVLSFSFPSEKKEYAYINFDGGYTALGYISGIEYEMDVSIEDDDGEVYASGKSEVIDILRSFDAGSTVKEGLFLKFNNGYVYTGSVTNTFTLRINTDKKYSDGTTTPESWISLVETTERSEKSNYKEEAEANLDYRAAPGGENPLAFVSNLFN